MVESKEEKNAKLIKLGRSKFVLFRGVLGWGIPVAIMFALLHGIIDGWQVFLPRLIEALILFPLTGIIVGRIMWKQLVRKLDRGALLR